MIQGISSTTNKQSYNEQTLHLILLVSEPSSSVLVLDRTTIRVLGQQRLQVVQCHFDVPGMSRVRRQISQ